MRNKKRTYLDILDQEGNVIGAVDARGQLHGLGQMGEFVPWGSIGGNIWEFLHPGQVQKEYEAVGKPPPSVEEIMTGSAADIGRNIEEGAEQAVENFAGLGQWIVIGLVAVALIQGTQLLQPLLKSRRGR